MHSAAKQKVEKLQKRLNRAEADLTELSEVMDAQQRQTLIIAESVQSMWRGILGYPHKTKIKVSINFDKQKWLLIFLFTTSGDTQASLLSQQEEYECCKRYCCQSVLHVGCINLAHGRARLQYSSCVCVCVCVCVLSNRKKNIFGTIFNFFKNPNSTL